MIILIIDDDYESNLRIKKTLEKSIHLDITVMDACNADEGLAIMKEYHPFIVITELTLADANGIENGKKILKEYVNTFVIGISQLKMFELVQECINSGFSGFHLKPIVKNEILDTIERLILSNQALNKKESSLIFPGNKFDEFETNMALPIKTAVEFINLNYFNSINLKDISKKVYLSPSHFSRMFKDEMDTTFIEYLTEVRIDKSKYFLKETSMPIEVIAHNIGFSSSTYFSTTFKKLQGKSPREYRSLYMRLDNRKES